MAACPWLAVLIVLLLGIVPARAAGLALVLAVDVSASVSAEFYLLQRNGIARAFENARLVDAIAAIAGGIEVLILEWSDPDRIAVTVGWRQITGSQSATAFAAAVRATQRSSRGLTAIGPALLAAASQFADLPEPAERRIIDISGDGMANFGIAPKLARDRVVAAGISINALAILTEEHWLEDYYRANIVGGPAAFVVAVNGPGSFGNAILRKLMQEVAGVVSKRNQWLTYGRRRNVSVLSAHSGSPK